MFHPDLIKGTPLGKKIQKYAFFSYEISEALKLQEDEKDIVKSIFVQIAKELESGNDKHSEEIIVANIELLLSYSQRFFDRQTQSTCQLKKGIVERYEQVLNDYFQSKSASEYGLPTVAYLASKLHLSANYLGNQIKKETGCSAQEYIQSKILDLAKERLLDLSKTISEVSFDLGYKYPHHFTRFFQQKTGYSPTEYRHG